MKKSLIALAALALLIVGCTENKTTVGIAPALNDNIAYQDETVRFTVIADGTIRMEYAPNGEFTDNKSFIATERLYPSVNYAIKEDGGNIVVETGKMKLSYKKGSGAFSADNLTITSGNALDKQFTWHPGDEQRDNLGGTYRTLDGYDGNIYWSWIRDEKVKMELPLENGIIARDGWTLIDDSKGLLFEDNGDGDLDWVKERSNVGAQDMYFMAYGHDYKGALNDYIKFAGRIPLPPRYVFGYWWSRYWSYSDAEMRKLVAEFEAYDIPLDVLVVDMDWHWTEEGKGGWTGYTWNDRLFPDSKKFLDFLKSRGLKITLNLHPADGVPAYEDKYASLAEFLGRDLQSKETIKWQSSDKRFMRGWFDKMLLPLENEGVDFWWLDWQQGLMDDSIKSLSNTWWLNYCVFENQTLNSLKRPMLYHRWGGLGNHRYQIGFSGDTYSTWESLDYQPYFNTTASNVGYGYWSHDLGGHMFARNGEELDRELYTRWMQLGTFLPVMRSHSTKTANMKKEPWNLGQPYMPAVTESVKLRYRIAPYIYTAAREAYETGVSLCRPLYYDYPEDEFAYSSETRNEYLFGNDMLIAPITKPMENGVSVVNIYLPEGNWYEVSTGEMIPGPATYERKFLIDEYPVYVKAGAVIPEYDNSIKNLASNDNKINLVVAPALDGKYETVSSIYEDNGNDKKYAEQYATTKLTNTIDGNVQTLVIGKREGDYKGMPSRREYAVSFRCAAMPISVTHDGKAVEWTYDGSQLAVNVELGLIDPKQSHTIVVTYPKETEPITCGIIGKMRRMANAMTAQKFRNAGIVFIEGFGQLGSAAQMLEYYPENFNAIISDFTNNYNRLPDLMEKQGMSTEDQKTFLIETVY